MAAPLPTSANQLLKANLGKSLDWRLLGQYSNVTVPMLVIILWEDARGTISTDISLYPRKAETRIFTVGRSLQAITVVAHARSLGALLLDHVCGLLCDGIHRGHDVAADVARKNARIYYSQTLYSLDPQFSSTTCDKAQVPHPWYSPMQYSRTKFAPFSLSSRSSSGAGWVAFAEPAFHLRRLANPLCKGHARGQHSNISWAGEI